MKKATWIWYPGDFERMLFNKCMAKRYERGMIITPFWRLDGYYSNVKFFRNFTLKRADRIRFRAEGEFNIFIDEIGYIKDFDGELSLPAGEYHMSVLVSNNAGLPCLFVEGEELVSDGDFTVTCQDFDIFPAGHWNLKESELPNSYRLPTEEKPFLRAERRADGTLYDCGRETVAYLRIRGAEKGSKIRVCYGESLEEALDCSACEQTDVFEIQGEDFVAPVTKAFRYVFIPGENEFTVSLLEEMPVAANKSSFLCSDKKLQKIWDASIRTIELTTREFFIDGPKRDRWSWSGDAILSEWFNYYTFADSETVKRTIRALGGKRPVKTHINHIMDYSMYWLISLHDYYLYTGDLDFVREMLPLAEEYIRFCMGRLDADGFLDNKPGDWVFIDWADMNNEGETSFEQILFSAALNKIAVLCDATGGSGKKYRQFAQDLYAKTKEVFCRDGVFRHARKDGILSEKVTRYANMFAVLYGLADEPMRKRTREMLSGSEVQKITTPYMRFYELVVMCELGMWDEMTHELTNYWGGMIDEGATTFWEQYDPQQKGAEKYAMYDRPYGKSLCHAWGAAPVYLISAYIFGIRPAAPGYTEFICRPFPEKICDCKLRIPAGDGYIFAEKRNNEFTIYNKNCPGTVIVPPGWQGERGASGRLIVPKDGSVCLRACEKEKRNAL